jgi:hypothetical protein
MVNWHNKYKVMFEIEKKKKLMRFQNLEEQEQTQEHGLKKWITYSIFIHQDIGRFQISMYYMILVQAVHSLGNINCYS